MDLGALVLLGIVFGIIGAVVGESKGYGAARGLVIGGLFSILGVIALLLLPPQGPRTDGARQAAGLMKCPECAELVQAEAHICRFCHHQFGAADLEAGLQAQAMAREERVKQRKAHESSFNRKVGLVAGLLVLVPVLFSVLLWLSEHMHDLIG